MHVALLLTLALQASGLEVVELEALHLRLTFPSGMTELVELPDEDEDEDLLGCWNAELGGKTAFVEVALWRKRAGREPEDITWRLLDRFRDEDFDGPRFELAHHGLIAGEYGFVPYVSVLSGTIQERGKTEKIGAVWYVAGIAEKTGWLMTIQVDPLPDESDRSLIEALIAKGMSFGGPKRNPLWAEDEVKARWEADSALDEKKQEKLEVIRTEHYLIMTNSSGGKLFAKQMELNYDVIQATYPFPEIPGRKLMPVFLFRDPEEYYAFYAQRFAKTLEAARKSSGVAAADFYATYYEAPKDPVHIHEATHQIFDNRLALGGGGSWFQEGVAEYIETRPNDRNDAARLVKKGRHTPLRELMQLRSLIDSKDEDKSGESAAAHNYKEAALLIEFLRESDFGKARFKDWMHAIGQLARNDVSGIEAVCKRIYGVSIEELDAKFVEYCAKR